MKFVIQWRTNTGRSISTYNGYPHKYDTNTVENLRPKVRGPTVLTAELVHRLG